MQFNYTLFKIRVPTQVGEWKPVDRVLQSKKKMVFFSINKVWIIAFDMMSLSGISFKSDLYAI